MKKSYIILLSVSAIFMIISSGLQAQVSMTGCSNPGLYSSAIGYHTTATGKFSMASGYRVGALADNAFIFGTAPAGVHTSEAIVSNKTKNSFLIVFGGKPLFFAKLASLASKENSDFSKDILDPGLGIDYSGTPAVGIGTIDPKETLDVRGNIKADTVKIIRSIFLPEKELSITYYKPGQSGGPGSFDTYGMESDDFSTDPESSQGIKTLLTLKEAGGPRLGIGVTDPKSALHVSGVGRFSSAIRIRDFETAIGGEALVVGGSTYITNGGLMIGKDYLSRDLKLQVDGNSYFKGTIGIGTNDTFGYTLAVNGNIGCKEVKVEVSNNWPDYVFDPEYNLKSIKELAAYIEENQHLPEIPSAKQVMNDGVGLAEMNALLLKKIEELTLYVIQQNARIEALEQGR